MPTKTRLRGRAGHRRPVRCAWCGSISGERARWHRPTLWRLLLKDREQESGLSHGICPACFAELAPGVAYPGHD